MEEENSNGIEDEMDKMEEEIKEEASGPAPKGNPGKGTIAEKPITERYTPFYVEAKMGILDTVTNEIVVEGLTDFSIATIEAWKFNKLDKIGIASGA